MSLWRGLAQGDPDGRGRGAATLGDQLGKPDDGAVGRGTLSIRTIQWYLKTMYGWKLSTGGIVGAIHGVARQAEPAVAEVLDLMRARWCTPPKPDGARTGKTAMSGPTALSPDGANLGQTVYPVGRR